MVYIITTTKAQTVTAFDDKSAAMFYMAELATEGINFSFVAIRLSKST